jgi:hypothetical protein
MATNNAVPFYPEISPQHIRDTAYRGCGLWLDGLLWQEELPKRNPPQRGSEAVRVLGATLSPIQRMAFIEGWNQALREWEARRALYLKRMAVPLPAHCTQADQPPSLRFKALAWSVSLVACLGFWWAVVLWLF